jgi:hypothetical protein
MAAQFTRSRLAWWRTTILIFFAGTTNALLVLSEPRSADSSTRLLFVWIALVALAALVIGRYRTLRLSDPAVRKKLADNAEKAYRTDSRSKVLYLRPFGTDRTTAHFGSVASETTSLFHEIMPLTEEQYLQKALAHLGPVRAIADPNDTAPPPPGVFKEHVNGSKRDEWKEVVGEGIDKADLVALASGAEPGRGFLWEVEQVVKRGKPERVVMFLVGGKAEYLKFREATAEQFPRPLPDYPEKKFGQVSGLVRAALVFDSQWTPKIVPFKGLERQPVSVTALPALEPIFDRIDPKWRKIRRKRLWRKALLALATLVVVLPGGVVFAAACTLFLR